MLTAVIFDMDGVLIDSGTPSGNRHRWPSSPDWATSHPGKGLQLHHRGAHPDQLVAHWYRIRPGAAPARKEVVQPHPGSGDRAHPARGTAQGRGAGSPRPHRGPRAQRSGSPPPHRLPWSRRCSANSASRTVSWRSTPPRWERFGKPTRMSISTPPKLGVEPMHCLAIEDSFTGLLAAKAASMTALIVPDPALVGDPRLAIANHELRSLAELNTEMLAGVGQSRQHPGGLTSCLA